MIRRGSDRAVFYHSMKASAEALSSNAVLEKSWAAVLADLVKARLTALVLLTTFVGFYLGERGAVNYLLMFHVLFGTALVASGAAALNQWLERDYDAKMRRTASRPLPSGRMQPATVAIFGGACSVIGLVYLAALVNPLTPKLFVTGIRAAAGHRIGVRIRRLEKFQITRRQPAQPAAVKWSRHARGERIMQADIHGRGSLALGYMLPRN